MRQKFKKNYSKLILLFVLLLVLLLVACSGAGNKTSVYTVKEISPFGNVVIDCSQEDMKRDGFDFGDIVKIEVGSYDFTFPIVSDYIYDVKNTGALVWYGDRNPAMGMNCSNLVQYFEMDDAQSLVGKDCRVTMLEKGGRKDYYESIKLNMTNDREDYSSDAEFANVYPVKGGMLKKGLVYRGSSLFDDDAGRIKYAQKLVEELGIRNVIDLTMSPEEADVESVEKSAYVDGLLSEDRIHFYHLGVDYAGEFKGQIATVFRDLMKMEGPVYINCQLGRDRTGMASILLMSAAGASYEEIKDNYMQTYYNYYKAEAGTPAYEAIETGIFTILMTDMTGAEDPSALTPAEITAGSAAYLKAGGLSDQEFKKLQKWLADL